MIVDKDQLQPYIDGDATLMPLHKWDKVIKKTNKEGEEVTKRLGKTPIATGWREEDKDEITKAALKGVKQGNNYGIRLGSEDLVVDVDPRNGGLESLPKLLEVMGASSIEELMDTYPTVITGGGGWHFYMTKPSGIKVVADLSKAGIPGIDLKTEGGYVVGAGSKHDEMDAYYKWDSENLGPPYSERPEAPLALLTIAERKESSGASDTEPGGISPEQLEELLSLLDPKEHSSYEEWISIMFSAHHGSNGQGKQVFLDWCAGDPKYASGHESNVSRHWDSATSDGSGRKLTINHIYNLIEKKYEDQPILPTIKANWAKLEFEDIEAIEEVEEVRKVSAVALDLTKQIHDLLIARLRIDRDLDEDKAARLKPNEITIDRMILNSFWSPASSTLYMLNLSGELKEFSNSDGYKFLTRNFGDPIDAKALRDLTWELNMGGEEGSLAEEARKEKHLKETSTMVKDIVVDHIKDHSQRNHLEWRTDMFTKKPFIRFTEDRAIITLTHRPFKSTDMPIEEVIEDYRKHFPRFDEFLDFLVNARFASNRKKAYLWIKANSDWGKGVLMEGVLGNEKGLGVTVETKEREIEAMFEGKPVGKSPSEFKRSLALVVNEFKTVKSELKELESTLTLSPKFQLSSTVEIFAKVFTSAETVNSLVTDNGVEDQFANRMSVFEEGTGDSTKDKIETRAVWKKYGSRSYVSSLRAYAARELNRRIERMQSLGREASSDEANRYLDEFIKRNGIGTVYQKFSESLPQVAQDIVEWLSRFESESADNIIFDSEGRKYLKSPAKLLENYIRSRYTEGNWRTMMRSSSEIYKLMSADGKGYSNHWVGGKSVKTILLKTEWEEEEEER